MGSCNSPDAIYAWTWFMHPNSRDRVLHLTDEKPELQGNRSLAPERGLTGAGGGTLVGFWSLPLPRPLPCAADALLPSASGTGLCSCASGVMHSGGSAQLFLSPFPLSAAATLLSPPVRPCDSCSLPACFPPPLVQSVSSPHELPEESVAITARCTLLPCSPTLNPWGPPH